MQKIVYISFLFGLMCLLLQSCDSQSCSRQAYHIFHDRSQLRNKRDCQFYTTSSMCGTYCNKENTCYNFEYLNEDGLCLLCIDNRTDVTQSGHLTQFTGNLPIGGSIFEKNDIDDCESSPCMHGGTCTDKVFNHTCACVNGTGGHYCEEDTLDECAANTCVPCSYCVDLPLQYQCVCESGFTGASCKTEIDECASNPCPASTTCVDRIDGYACKGLPNPVNNTGIDCADLYKKGVNENGVYMIQPANANQPLQVYCDMQTDGGGWIVFQRRVKFDTSFDRTWAEYKAGFGDIFNDYWLGNDNLAMLTAGPTEYVLHVKLANIECKTGYAEYDNFHVADESQLYKLSIGTYKGTLGESLSEQHNMNFTTKDRDNDEFGPYNCASFSGYHGAFWYKKCSFVALNNAKTTDMRWVNWRITPAEKKNSTMMFRPMNFP